MIQDVLDQRENESSLLRKAQLIEFHLLEALDAICKKHGIRYFLVDGTLLGAIRHNGFIPWDDDIDVGMTMPDLKKFLKVANTELPEGVVLQGPRHGNVFFAHYKLRDSRSLVLDGESISSGLNGIFIDIFQYERMPNLPYRFVHLLVRLRAGSFRRWRFRLLYARSSVSAKFCDCLYAAFWKTIQSLGIVLWHGLRLIAPSKGWHMVPEAEYPNWILDRQLYPCQRHLFEGCEFPIPQDWEWVLAAEYKNWRELPPEDQRVTHSSVIIPDLGKFKI